MFPGGVEVSFGIWEPFAAFGAGFLASLSPCVYPIIPLAIGVISSNAKDRKHGILLTLSFVLGLSVLYTALGFFAAFGGVFLGQMAGSGFLNLLIGIFAIVGALMFWNVVKMPSFAFASKLDKKIGFVGVFVMGMLSSVVASACTAPFLLGLLPYIASKQNVLWGGFLMVCFSLGLGSLFLGLGIFASLSLYMPKPGKWMKTVHGFSAWLLLIVGLYFVFNAGRLW